MKKRISHLTHTIFFIVVILLTNSSVEALLPEGAKKEPEQVPCTDSKGNPNGYGSKCIAGECSCTPNAC